LVLACWGLSLFPDAGSLHNRTRSLLVAFLRAHEYADLWGCRNMENTWSDLQSRGIEVEETEVPDNEFEHLFGEVSPGTVDEE
jgi:hypothetical protein